MVGKMLKSVKIIKNIRKVFKAGEIIPLRPLTFIVGDNGSGKTTFLELLSERFIYSCSESVYIPNESLKEFQKFSHFDLEKHNPRKQGEQSITLFGIVSAFRSHGEMNMDLFVHDFAEKQNEIILLDEPDQALSIRSIYRLFKIFEKMISNGCQIIAAVHSQTLMELVDEVYSVEHKKWMKPSEFLKTQRRPKKLKTVDSFKKNKRYQVKFIMSDGDIRYLDADRNHVSIERNASAFKRKTSAENCVKKFIPLFNDRIDLMGEFEKKFYPKIVEYEIEEFEPILEQG